MVTDRTRTAAGRMTSDRTITDRVADEAKRAWLQNRGSEDEAAMTVQQRLQSHGDSRQCGESVVEQWRRQEAHRSSYAVAAQQRQVQ